MIHGLLDALCNLLVSTKRVGKAYQERLSTALADETLPRSESGSDRLTEDQTDALAFFLASFTQLLRKVETK